MKGKIRIGLVGSGNMARRHLYAIRKIKDAQVLAICGRNEATLRAMCCQFKIKQYYTNLNDLLSRDDVDAIDVVTPTYTHEEIVVLALRSGRHVFCEKPISLNLAQADRMLEAEHSANKILMIGFPLRFTREFVYAKELITRGLLGDIKVVWFRSGRCLPKQSWYQDKEKSGGVTAELAVHFIDCLRWLIGDEIKSVVSEATSDIYKLGKEDNIWAIYRFSNGAIGVVGSSYSFNFFEEDGGIIGDKLSLKFHRGRIITDDYRKRKSLFTVAIRDYLSGLRIPFALFRDSALATELQHFVGCIKNNLPPKIDATEARKTLEAVVATVNSAKSGQRIELN